MTGDVKADRNSVLVLLEGDPEAAGNSLDREPQERWPCPYITHQPASFLCLVPVRRAQRDL